MNVFKTWKALAAALGVSEKTLREWRAQPGAPTTKDIRDWNEWRANRSTANDRKGEQVREGLIGMLPDADVFDEIVAEGLTDYGTLKTREQARTERHKAEKAKAERDEARGSLVPAKKVTAYGNAVRDRIHDAIRELPALVSRDIEGINGKQRRQLSEVITKHIDNALHQGVKQAQEDTRGVR